MSVNLVSEVLFLVFAKGIRLWEVFSLSLLG